MTKNAFITWGGWDGHEPEQTAAIFAEVLRTEGYQVEVSNALDAFEDQAFTNSQDLIVPVLSLIHI